MNTALTMERIAKASPSLKARIAGVLYLISGQAFSFSEFSVRGKLVVSNDAAATGTICRLLGHQDIKMTMRYAHLAPGYMKAAVNILTKRRKRTGTRTGTE